MATPGYTHLFFAESHLVNEIGELCNASVARLFVSLIEHSLSQVDNLQIQRQQLQHLSLKQFSCWLSTGQFTCLALNSYLGILQPISSKPYILLSRNLMEGFRQHEDSEIAKIIPFAYQRLPSTKQPSWNSSDQHLHSNYISSWAENSWNSSNIIIFQTIYPLEQELGERQQADRVHRKAEIIPLRCQRVSSIEQPSCNSSNIIFQTICPLERKSWWEMPGKINPEWLKQFFSDIKEGHSLVIHLEILQTTYFVIIRPYIAAGCLRLWQFLVIPTCFLLRLTWSMK